MPLLLGAARGGRTGPPVVLVTAGMTDARHYDDLGIQTYGFLPIAAPSRLPSELLHAPDERVSVAALERGAAALESVIERIALRSGGIDKRAVAQITFRAERSRVKR